MKDKRVLIISSEVVPYLPQTEQAKNSFFIPKSVNESGGQTRIFMPRYGLINERSCLLYTSPSPRDRQKSRMPSSA